MLLKLKFSLHYNIITSCKLFFVTNEKSSNRGYIFLPKIFYIGVLAALHCAVAKGRFDADYLQHYLRPIRRHWPLPIGCINLLIKVNSDSRCSQLLGHLLLWAVPIRNSDEWKLVLLGTWLFCWLKLVIFLFGSRYFYYPISFTTVRIIRVRISYLSFSYNIIHVFKIYFNDDFL